MYVAIQFIIAMYSTLLSLKLIVYNEIAIYYTTATMITTMPAATITPPSTTITMENGLSTRSS